MSALCHDPSRRQVPVSDWPRRRDQFSQAYHCLSWNVNPLTLDPAFQNIASITTESRGRLYEQLQRMTLEPVSLPPPLPSSVTPLQVPRDNFVYHRQQRSPLSSAAPSTDRAQCWSPVSPHPCDERPRGHQVAFWSETVPRSTVRLGHVASPFSGLSIVCHSASISELRTAVATDFGSHYQE